MRPWPTPRVLPAGVLEELVRVAFSQRRKLLRHTLGRWLDERGYAGVFNVQRRAEEVAVSEYLDLAEALQGTAAA
jgi:16S rRNA (adenine1518-N6/adenine1519-N6)-dimethyltransferase